MQAVDKGLVAVVWDRDGYLKEAYKQCEDRDVYEGVPNNPSVLVNIIINALEKICLHSDLSGDNLFFCWACKIC